jgi:hypothetical protein
MESNNRAIFYNFMYFVGLTQPNQNLET